MPRITHLEVDKAGLFATFRDQFRSSITFLREAMQNARRSGATAVNITFDPETNRLAIADDGSGINDPDDLFTIGRSGFRNLDHLAQERPFGVGFAAGLFAADRIKVETRSFCADFSPEAALGSGGIEVIDDLPGLFYEGTRLSFWLSERRRVALGMASGQDDLNLSRMERLVQNNARGFPIPVFFNGAAIDRTHALDDSFVGDDDLRLRIDFDAIFNREAGRYWADHCWAPPKPALYIQGLPLGGIGCGTPDEGFVVHIGDSFRALMPDRSAVIEEQEDDCQTLLKLRTQAAWHDFLAGEKARMSAEAFVRTYWVAAMRYAPSLLVDLPIPGHLCLRPTEPVPADESYEGEFRDSYGIHDVVDAPEKVAVGSLYMDCSDPDDGCFGSARSLVAVKRGLTIVSGGLPDNHWGRSCFNLDDLEPTVTPVGVAQELNFNGKGPWSVGVVFCDHYLLDAGDGSEPIEVDDLAVSDPAIECRIIFPRKATNFENALRQVDSYRSGDYSEAFMADWLDSDAAQLSVMHALAFDDPANGLAQIVSSSLGSVLDAMRGRSFSVSVAPDGRVSAEIC